MHAVYNFFYWLGTDWRKGAMALVLLIAVILNGLSDSQAVSPTALAPMVLPVMFSDSHIETIDDVEHFVFDDTQLRITMPVLRVKDTINPVKIYWWQHGEWKLKAILYGETFDPFKGGKWTKHLRDLYLAL